jgi:hypothetical protein
MIRIILIIDLIIFMRMVYFNIFGYNHKQKIKIGTGYYTCADTCNIALWLGTLYHWLTLKLPLKMHSQYTPISSTVHSDVIKG